MQRQNCVHVIENVTDEQRYIFGRLGSYLKVANRLAHNKKPPNFFGGLWLHAPGHAGGKS